MRVNKADQVKAYKWERLISRALLPLMILSFAVSPVHADEPPIMIGELKAEGPTIDLDEVVETNDSEIRDENSPDTSDQWLQVDQTLSTASTSIESASDHDTLFAAVTAAKTAMEQAEAGKDTAKAALDAARQIYLGLVKADRDSLKEVLLALRASEKALKDGKAGFEISITALDKSVSAAKTFRDSEYVKAFPLKSAAMKEKSTIETEIAQVAKELLQSVTSNKPQEKIDALKMRLADLKVRLGGITNTLKGPLDEKPVQDARGLVKKAQDDLADYNEEAEDRLKGSNDLVRAARQAHQDTKAIQDAAVKTANEALKKASADWKKVIADPESTTEQMTKAFQDHIAAKAEHKRVSDLRVSVLAGLKAAIDKAVSDDTALRTGIKTGREMLKVKLVEATAVLKTISDQREAEKAAYKAAEAALKQARQNRETTDTNMKNTLKPLKDAVKTARTNYDTRFAQVYPETARIKGIFAPAIHQLTAARNTAEKNLKEALVSGGDITEQLAAFNAAKQSLQAKNDEYKTVRRNAMAQDRIGITTARITMTNLDAASKAAAKHFTDSKAAYQAAIRTLNTALKS